MAAFYSLHHAKLDNVSRFLTFKFKLLSINVRGLVNDKKRRAIFDKHRFNADLLILQETHSSPEIEGIWTNEWGGKSIFAHGSSSARGVSVFMSKSIAPLVSNVHIGEDGRLVILDLKQEDNVISVCAIYAPNQDTPTFFSNIGLLMKERSEQKIIIGDFNLTLNIELDRENTYNNNSKAKEEVQNLCEEFYLRDIWRDRNPDIREFSWKQSRHWPIKASRIDFALVSGGLDQQIQTVQYLSSVFTDHRGIYLVVQLENNERGTGYWKLNNSLLASADYIELMNEEIKQTLQSTQGKPSRDRWEIMKKRIKKTSIDFSKNKVRMDQQIIANLSEILNEYESRLPLNIEENKLMEDTRTDLEDKTLERIQGVMFRSKAKWYEEGEKNTKYFYSLEKAKYNAKTCYKMVKEDGEEITNPSLILEEQRHFYEELYDVDQDVCFNMQNNSGTVVPETIRKQQQEQLTMKDLEEAIKGMNNNKTPGEDGIPVDFYKVFWNLLKDLFYESMIENFERKELHCSARKGILNLIPKANKDTRFVKNLRPITLLNTDYKIVEKAVANKMIPALEYIIHKDQRGFMKDRRISVNIRKMLDIIHLAQKEDLEAVILSLDFVKCFDKCSFSILHGSLDFFQFGSIIKQWTRILYHDFSVKIQNNGYFSRNIAIKKGVHQGGCCSSIYFLVIAEILAISLRANEEIEGITIQDIKHLLNQFADDMDVFSLASEKSIKAILEELDKFRLQSGFTVSYEKTTLYRIGSLRHSNAMMYNMDQFAWSNQDITVLGITIAHQQLVEKNYSGIVEKTKQILGAWNNRGLSLLGKVQVVNTLIASLFVYKMMVLPQIPPNIVKCLDNTVREFLWNGRKAKIAYNTLQNPKSEGGLNLVNFQRKDSSLKATWPQILANEREYATIVYKVMRVDSLEENIWRCRLNPLDCKQLKISDPFWAQVLESWSYYNYSNNFREENQILWYNSSIKVNKKVIMWKDVYQKGLVYVHQLFENLEFKSAQTVWEEYGLTVLRYNSLKVALPKQWKDFFCTRSKQTFQPIPPHNYDTCIYVYGRSFSSRVYKYMADDILTVHNKYIKWIEELGRDFCESLWDFRKFHIDIYRITNVAKYRSFQYRLVQRGIVTNVQLEKWGMEQTNSCTFCKKEPETLKHLFYYCTFVQQLWSEVYEYCKVKFGLSTEMLSVECKNILFNRVMERNHVVNFICLITKQYVYRQRCAKEALHFPQLKAIISNVERIEKYIATKNNRLEKHYRKWDKKECIRDQNYIREYIDQISLR